LISDDDALPRGGPGREALNAYQSCKCPKRNSDKA
jgi:hypothetical protein